MTVAHWLGLATLDEVRRETGTGIAFEGSCDLALLTPLEIRRPRLGRCLFSFQDTFP